MFIGTKIDSYQLVKDMVQELDTKDLLSFISTLVNDKYWFDGNFPQEVIKRLEEDYS